MNPFLLNGILLLQRRRKFIHAAWNCYGSSTQWNEVLVILFKNVTFLFITLKLSLGSQVYGIEKHEKMNIREVCYAFVI